MNTTTSSQGAMLIAQCHGQAAQLDDSSHARTSISLPVEVAVELLEARGWTVELIPTPRRYSGRGASFCFVMPGQKLRADGGEAGTDYVWDLGEALTTDLHVLNTELEG